MPIRSSGGISGYKNLKTYSASSWSKIGFKRRDLQALIKYQANEDKGLKKKEFVYIHYLQEHYKNAENFIGLKNEKVFDTTIQDVEKSHNDKDHNWGKDTNLQAYKRLMKQSLKVKNQKDFAYIFEDADVLDTIDEIIGAAFGQQINIEQAKKMALEQYASLFQNIVSDIKKQNGNKKPLQIIKKIKNKKTGKQEDKIKQAENLYQLLGYIRDISTEPFRDLCIFLEKINSIVQLMEKSLDGENNIVLFNLFNNFLLNIKKSLKGSKDITEIAKQMTDVIKDFDFTIVEKEYFKEAVHKYELFIKALAAYLETGKSLDTVMQNLQQGLISQALGQATALFQDSVEFTATEKIKNDLEINISKSLQNNLKKSVGNFTKVNITTNGEKPTLTGKQKVENKYFSGPGTKVTYKTDVKGQQLNISVESNEGKFSIVIDLGLSVKFYKKMNWKARSTKNELTIESGSGGSLKQFFDSMRLKDESKYEIYNYLTFMGLTPEIKNLVLNRYFFRLFSSASAFKNENSDDFSHYLLANGQLVSFYQIAKLIDKSTKRDFIELYFQSKNKKNGKKITENKNWMFLNKWINQGEDEGKGASVGRKNIQLAFKRSNIIYDDINRATIHASLHLHKLANSFSNKKNLTP